MPIYVYECDSCQRTYEVEQRISEEALTRCTQCENGKVKRIIQPVGVAFKGSGFYVTDSANSNPLVDKNTTTQPEVKSNDKPKSE